MTAPGKDFSKAPAPRLFKKKVPDDEPVTPQSAVLFRFGEQCNNDCPMCSNTGDPALFFHPTETLLRRAEFVRDRGFRRAKLSFAKLRPWVLMSHVKPSAANHSTTVQKPG